MADKLQYVSEKDYSSRAVAEVIDYIYLVEDRFKGTLESMENEGFVPVDLEIHDDLLSAVMQNMMHIGDPNLPEKEKQEAARKFADVGVLYQKIQKRFEQAQAVEH